MPDTVLGERNRQVPYSNRAYNLVGREMQETKCIPKTGATRNQGNKVGWPGKNSLGKWHLSRHLDEVTGELYIYVWEKSKDPDISNLWHVRMTTRKLVWPEPRQRRADSLAIRSKALEGCQRDFVEQWRPLDLP